MEDLSYIVYGLGALCIILLYKLHQLNEMNKDLGLFIKHMVENNAEVIRIVKRGGDENAPPF